MADLLLDAAINGDEGKVSTLLIEVKDSAALLHAFIGALSAGHKDVMAILSRRQEFKASLFNNAALKWALVKKNDHAIDLITKDETFSFGTHLGILHAAVKGNNFKVAKMALNCPTLNFTKEFLVDALKKAMKLDHLDVMTAIYEDHRYEIQGNDLRMLIDEDVPAEYRTKYFHAMLNNPGLNARTDHLLEVGLDKNATPEMRRMAYLYDPENDDDCIADKLAKVDDFALFKLNCGSDAEESLKAAASESKYEWVEYMKDHKKIPEEVLKDFDVGDDKELTFILKPELIPESELI